MRANDPDFSVESRHQLAGGILKQAAQDLRRIHGAKNKIGRELYLDAYRWLSANDFFWPFSFLNVCQVLSLARQTVRAELMRDLSLGTFRHWRRRLASAIAV